MQEEKIASKSVSRFRKLKTDYIDLLLIHQPSELLQDVPSYGTSVPRRYELRAIQFDNFYDARFVDLVENVEVKPSVLQLETRLFPAERMRELINDCRDHLMA